MTNELSARLKCFLHSATIINMKNDIASATAAYMSISNKLNGIQPVSAFAALIRFADTLRLYHSHISTESFISARIISSAAITPMAIALPATMRLYFFLSLYTFGCILYLTCIILS